MKMWHSRRLVLNVVFLLVLIIQSTVDGSIMRDLIRPHRIVGGEEVEPGNFPWQVSLKTQGSHFCGATLISPKWVLTAAHCTNGIKYSEVRAVLGAWDLARQYTEYRIKKVFRNTFVPKTMQNDIALLRLSNDPSSKSKTGGRPIKMETEMEVANKTCSVSGWGRTRSSAGVQLPYRLRAANVQLLKDDECQAAMSRTYSYTIFNSNLCAGGSDRDACQGDSGGPLVCCGDRELLDTCRLTGIVSWGIGCATPGIPGIYTEVAHYRNWIYDTISGYEKAATPDQNSLFYSIASEFLEVDIPAAETLADSTVQ